MNNLKFFTGKTGNSTGARPWTYLLSEGAAFFIHDANGKLMFTLHLACFHDPVSPDAATKKAEFLVRRIVDMINSMRPDLDAMNAGAFFQDVDTNRVLFYSENFPEDLKVNQVNYSSLYTRGFVPTGWAEIERPEDSPEGGNEKVWEVRGFVL